MTIMDDQYWGIIYDQCGINQNHITQGIFKKKT